MSQERLGYNAEKAILGAVLLFSGCAPKLSETAPRPEKREGEAVAVVTEADFPAIEKEPLVNVSELRQAIVSQLTEKGVPESQAIKAANTSILGFFGKGVDSSSIRLIVNKDALANGLALRFDRPTPILEKLGISGAEFDQSRVAFAEEASKTWNLPVRIADESSTQPTSVQTSGKGKKHGGSTESYYSSDQLGGRPIWNLRVKSVGVDYDYLTTRYVEKMPFRTPAERIAYWNSLIDLVTSHELGHAQGADHTSTPLVLKDGNPSRPDVSLMASSINVTYDYRLSPSGSYVTGELVTNIVDPEADPALIATAFIRKSLKARLDQQAAAVGAKGFEK